MYGQLRVADGALAYASTPQGIPIAEDGKPIADPVKIKEFLGQVTVQKAEIDSKSQKSAPSEK